MCAEARIIKQRFLRWQCRSRQNAMRLQAGRPDQFMAPIVSTGGAGHPSFALVTVLCRSPDASVLPEMIHMAKKTHDPAERRRLAVEFMSASYFQRAGDFTGDLVACIPAASVYHSSLASSAQCRLEFRDGMHIYELPSGLARLPSGDREREECWWHNFLFNARLEPAAVIFAFRPDWSRSKFRLAAD